MPMNQVITDAMQATLTREVTEQIDQLGATAMLIRDQRAIAVGALRDIHLGAQMQLDSVVWTGAALGLIKEFKRVALAALRECDV
jgi:hypothetical protein